MLNEKKEIYVIQNVDMAITILDMLAEESSSPTNNSINHIASHLDLSRNKTFRLLYTLQERGLVDKDELIGTYRLSHGAVELGQKFIRSASVVQHAHPVMEELARKHDEAVYMTVMNGEDVLFIDMVDCGQQVKATSLIGRRFPLLSTSAGMIMKALESRDALEKLIKRRKKAGEVIDPVKIADELDVIRRRGVAIDRGGLGEEIISVAVAVRDYAGAVVGALTMLGPAFRMFGERLESEIIPSLQEGAEILSAKFGYAPV